MHELNLIALTAIAVLSVTCQWLAWKLRVPAILFLLLAGIIVGPISGLLHPDQLFGELLNPFISLAVAIILFEGGLSLKFSEIQGLERVVRNLLTFGLLSTWLITAAATHWLVGFSWELSFLFGALVVVTGPTVIVPMLRTVRPTKRIANILRWEGIAIDPIGALLAVLVFNFIVSSSSDNAWQQTLLSFAGLLITGIGIGALTGYILGIILRHFLLPEYLHNLAALTLVFASYTLSNFIMEESGLLAVTVMGMWLANMRNIYIEDIVHFKEHLTVLLISGLFVILAARIEFDQFKALGWPAIGVLAVIQLLARPAKVFISTLGSSLHWKEKALIAWIAPRGIVAAAISTVFALRLEEMGFQQAQLIIPLTFTIIIGTVTLQSATARWFALQLKVVEPDPNGLLIIGANSFSRKIAKALNALEISTILTDTNWDNTRAARMEGLTTYYGHPVSEHADQYLDLTGIGKMLALSPRQEFNALMCVGFRRVFGRNEIYTLSNASDKKEKDIISTRHRGTELFSHDATYNKLASILSQGGAIKTTRLSEDFDFNNFIDKYGKRAIPLFALDASKKLRIFTTDSALTPISGWQLISLIQDA